MVLSENKTSSKVLIIGAGFSGLATACQLRREHNCDDYVIYDRSPAPGGTWWANKYPGCAVDIPAVFYSLSFAPNPDFSKVYPPQAEILEYFNKVADKFDVSRHIVRNTEWEGAYWQDLTNSWLVKLKDLSTGQTFYHECKILISAVGALVNPNRFGIPGVETFEGDIVHTAAWKADLSLHQKDVIVVGNGCSAAQLIPAISKEAGSITQFIRTPQFYLQNENMQINDKWKFIFRYVPGVLRLLRLIVFLVLESTAVRFNINYKGNKARNLSAERSKAYIQSTAPDDPIVKISSHSIFTNSGQEYPADAILLATGFALTQYEVELVGRNGRTRDEHWGNFGYKEAYKSIAMSGFPNFFYVLGPNSGKGHTSAIYCIENYVNLVMKVIAPVLQDRASFVEVKPDSEKEYNENLHEKIATTIFNSSCSSKNWFIYPWNSFVMWYSTHWGRSDDWTYDARPDKNHRVFSFSHLLLLLALGIIPISFKLSMTVSEKLY
ncbi:Flavin-containing monooxygenase-like [Penicillium camemberti]|uniref:Flavin-containing monooxygenase-like n=1 Tax=Penicillium camemberti (strain FM 013) TaxID=1429867 RepID=A0A0G4P8V6_PENC3|nr:Flavin-containing monooxygenase-like [Penicillium camemberti]